MSRSRGKREARRLERELNAAALRRLCKEMESHEAPPDLM